MATVSAMRNGWKVDLGLAGWTPEERQEPWYTARAINEAGLIVRLRITNEADGPLRVTAVIVERDGHELTARDLRKIQLRELVDSLPRYRLAGQPNQHVKPARPGPAGHPQEHWDRVWALYQQARAAGTRSYIRWMRERWEPPVPDATMRRWVATAKNRFEGRSK